MDIPKIFMPDSEQEIDAEDAMKMLTEEDIDKGSYCAQTVVDMKKCIEYLVKRVMFLELTK